jgi:hypothetical protein
MKPDSSSIDQSADRVGLCACCIHARTVRSSHGSTFVLCKLSGVGGRFPKYPRLPVLHCPGFDQSEASLAE